MKILYSIFLFLLPFAGAAQFQPAPIFSSGMVFQRDAAIPVWGKGIPGENVMVWFKGQLQQTKVGQDSTWKVWLNAKPASERPASLMLQSGQSKMEIQNILIGDVWLCLGQSNMQWPMQREMHYRAEIPNSTQPDLRFYNPAYAGEQIFGAPFPDSVLERLNRRDFYQGQWEISDSNTFRKMSAVGYYFGKSILKTIQIPIGLIDLSIGGAPIETFIPFSSLKDDPEFSAKTSGNWLTNPDLPVWVRERGLQNLPGRNEGSQEKVAHPFQPGFAYATGIEPLLPFPIKGILWYQGESNAQEWERVEEYGRLCQLMVKAYRQAWGVSDLPFYFVQLSSIDTLKYKGHLWPEFRDMQRTIPEYLPHSGMAVSSDIGALNDVHPTNKKFVGERLARQALFHTYSQKITPSGPMPVNAKYRNGVVNISFQFGENMNTDNQGELKGFSIDGVSPATARISGKKVRVPAPQKPGFIYYGWQPYSLGNLYNGDALPASTFKIPVK